MNRKNIIIFLCFVLLAAPSLARAGIVFSEIMYDLDGSDTDREWVEIFNDGPNAITIKGGSGASWRFNDGSSNRILYEPPEHGGRGSMTLGSGEYAVIARDPATFYSMHPGGTFTVMRSAFTLNNTGASVSLIDDTGNIVNSATYANSMGANDDGNSLQKNSSGGWMTSSPSPGLGVLSAQTSPGASPPESAPSGSDISSSATSSNSSSSNAVSNWPVEPQVFANAGKDKTVVVGASTVFDGKALGLLKKPLENGRYLWNFGDGATGEGKMVEHTYRHPGDYLVVMEVASGYFSGEDRLKVRAEPSPLSVSAITDASGYFIELSNSSNTDIDISGWGLALLDKVFAIPKNTFVMAGKKLIFPNEVTSLIVAEGSVPELHYPNGTLASRFGEVKNKIVPVEGVVIPESEQPAVSEIIAPSVAEVSAGKSVKIAKAEENDSVRENMAAVAESSPKKSSTNYIWLLGVAGISALALGGVFLARKLERPNDEIEKLADEIEIIEE